MDLRIAKAIQLVEADLSKCYTERWLADSTGMTREHFGRLFKRETGESPMSFLRRLRFEEARRILESGEHLNLTIKEISNKVGVHDASHFVREFQVRFGYSPARYRQVKNSTK
ncbi:MAG TPA: helix-turn-helix domain-containing protein [Pyrinomonadaceae bacterium]|jgi:transcriptional regulator GlxA family with amidase domain|nr:helix-turn-helix domain-containing protein [Pyrinomonadaceae bacterium]